MTVELHTTNTPAAARSRSPSRSSSPDQDAMFANYDEYAPARPQAAVCVESVACGGVEVRLTVDAAPGCGGVTWPSGEVMARYLAYRHGVDPSVLAGKTVLELGSGTGLVGIAAALLEPQADVWVTDQDVLLDLMRANAELNIPGAEGKNLHVAELSWGEEIVGVPTDVGVILAADCVYFEPAFPLLVKTLCDLAPVGKEIEILFAWKKRRKADKRFFMMLKKHFDSETVMDDMPGAKEVYTREGVSLLRLTRRK